MRRSTTIVPLALLLCASVPLAGCKKGDEAEKETEAVVPVKVVKAERKDVSESVTAPGPVAPKAVADVSPKVAAPIAAMGILKNQYVRAGETIATLESRDLRAAASEA